MKKAFFLPAFMLMALSSVAQTVEIKNIRHERILIDNRYAPDAKGEQLLATYHQRVDSLMSPVVGYTAKAMKAAFPESELSNLISDITVWGGKLYAESPEIGLCNVSGIRAQLPEGAVTFGNINDMAPFENRLNFGTLTGQQLIDLFTYVGKNSFGFGVSKGVKIVYDKERNLKSVTFNGEEIALNRRYRIATIDYLMNGNDGFLELKKATFLVSPHDQHAILRNVIASYFREQQAYGKKVDANIEGRIVIE